MNNHRVVFSLLNCHTSWKSDKFSDMRSLNTDQLLIPFDWRIAADTHVRPRPQHGMQPECTLADLLTELQLEAQFHEQKKKCSQNVLGKDVCYCQAGQTRNETKVRSVFIQAVKLLRGLCHLFFMPKGPRIADGNVPSSFCYLMTSH